MYDNTWDAFFGNPVIKTYLTEADMSASGEVPSDPKLDQLQADVEQGTLSQEDLISMYKAGKITKDEIDTILNGGNQMQAPVDPQTGEPQLSEEELLAQQVDQTNDLFIKFSIYDKITELSDKLDYFEENFEDMQSDVYRRVIQLKEFLNILSNLVFNIETSVAYQMYGSLLLQLTELLQEYNKESAIENAREEAQPELKDPKDPVEHWADQNEADKMPDDKGQDHGQTNE